jgi:hypothetical protein
VPSEVNSFASAVNSFASAINPFASAVAPFASAEDSFAPVVSPSAATSLASAVSKLASPVNSFANPVYSFANAVRLFAVIVAVEFSICSVDPVFPLAARAAVPIEFRRVDPDWPVAGVELLEEVLGVELIVLNVGEERKGIIVSVLALVNADTLLFTEVDGELTRLMDCEAAADELTAGTDAGSDARKTEADSSRRSSRDSRPRTTLWRRRAGRRTGLLLPQNSFAY